MEPTVENFCNLLSRSRLLSPDEVLALRERWGQEAPERPSDPERFARWLVANRSVTEFQAAALLRGHAGPFFLNDYKLLERIGKGRMAGVYRAVHPLGQVVAIKVLPPSKAKEPEILARFQREARLAVRLKHPNVVRTFQTGTAEGVHYLVMEYLDGETLEEVLERRGKLGPAEAVRLIYQALQGLQHIHEQDLVHRDLKPGNLMLVSPPGAQEEAATLHATVKILDIGLGRALFDEGVPGAGDNFNLTTAGDVIGTPDYLAPEQARDSHAADVRADIYSLGCVLFHAVTGQPPFPDPNPVRQMVRHATEPLGLLRQLNRAVPEGLQPVVERMTAKDPAQRYATPEQAARALQPFLAARTERSAAAGPVPHSPAYLRWLETNQTAATAAAGSPGRPAAPPGAPPSAAPSPPIPSAPTPPQPPAGYSPTKIESRTLNPTWRERVAAIGTAIRPGRRDLIWMGVGGAAVLLAEGGGWLLAQALRRLAEGTDEDASK